MIRATMTFPESFLWGTATAAHQVEGENRNNDFWDWEMEPGRIAGGQRSGRACDWWGGRWREDFDRAAEAGQNTHRLSVEWSRIEPEPGRIDGEALAAYREIVAGARQRGLRPMVTLHHFTNPRWFQERGGWLDPQAPAWFERFVEAAVPPLVDLVDEWITINEPNVYAYAAYTVGAFPPGATDIGGALRVIEHLIQAHARAYAVIHRLSETGRVGIAHHVRGFRPAHAWNPVERASAWLRNRFFNESVPGAVHDGWVRIPGRNVRIPQAAGTQDFFGLNYYTTEIVRMDLGRPAEFLGRSAYPEEADVSPSGFIANAPDGFWRALVWARRFRLPILVTENGIEDDTDQVRRRYLAAHLRQLWRAANFNWRIEGYYHWTLVDNFEWERGWTQRYGLWELNPETQERRRRASADFYAEICRANALSADSVARFAPDALEELFPSRGPGKVAFMPAFEE